MRDSAPSAPNRWLRVPMTELADISFSGVDKKSAPNEIPVRLCNYVDVFHNHQIDGRIEFQEATATEREVAKFQLRRGDVVFTKDSETAEEIAEPAYVAEDLDGVLCGYHLAIARPREGVDGRFLYYAMKEQYTRRQFVRVANGVTRFGLTLDAIGSILIPRPAFDEQRHIGEVLSTWDLALRDTSILRQRLAVMYEALANRCVRFRGPHMRSLSDLLSADKMQPVVPNGPFRALGVRSHGKGTFQRIDDLTVLGSNKIVYRIEPNRLVVNIVFAWEGAAAITSEIDAGCLASHRFPTFTINEKLIDPDYMRHMIRMKPFHQLLGLASPGGAGRNKTLNRSDFLKFAVHVPPISEQRRAAAALSTLERRLSLLDRYREQLTAQRDSLAAAFFANRLEMPRVAGAAVR